MQRLAALVPRPRLHLIRFHGVLAPHAALRAAIVPGPPHKPGIDAAHRAPEAPARMGLSAVAQARVRYRPRTLPAVWRRLQDYRRHRRARRDCQDPHAPGLAGARAAALPGAAAGAFPGGLISKARRFCNGADAPARPALARSNQSASACGDSSRCRDQIVIASREFPVTIARLTASRTGHLSRSQSNRRLIFLIAPKH